MKASRCAVVFDWNGTLVADSALCIAANNKTFEFLGLEPISMAHFRDVYDVPLLRMYLRLGAKEEDVLANKDELVKIFVKHYECGAQRLRARKGAQQMLRQLKAQNHKLAVLSNYTTEKIKPQAERLGLLSSFDGVLANEDVGNVYHKGKADRLQAFVDKHETQKAIIVGDTPEEIEIAHAHGFIGVAITDGVCSVSRLRAVKPDFLIRSLEEMPAIAKKVFGKDGA